MAPDGVGNGAAGSSGRTLEGRIFDCLVASERPLTSSEIARRVRARKVDVLQALVTGASFYLWPTYDRRKLYGVTASPNGRASAPGARERTRTASSTTLAT